MRKISAGLFISLDGVIEAPDKWSFPYMTDEIGQTIGMLIGEGDTLLLGRRTYEDFAQSFGAGMDDPMAEQMNSIAKVVVSTTLPSADWQNSTLVKDDVAGAITRLKQQPGRKINMSGSGTLLGWLLEQGLLDELHLLVMPVVVGSGRRLFDDVAQQTPMALAASESFSNGVLHLTYQPAAA